MVPNDKVALAAAHRRDVTLRQAIRLSLGGEALRVRISNLHGAEPLVIDAASVGHPARPGLGDIIDPLAAARSVMLRYQVAGIEVQALLATARWRMRFRWRGSAHAGNLGGFYH